MPRNNISLMPHQTEGTEFLRQNERAALFDEQGLGKSKQLIDAIAGVAPPVAPPHRTDARHRRALPSLPPWPRQRVGIARAVHQHDPARRDVRRDVALEVRADVAEDLIESLLLPKEDGDLRRIVERAGEESESLPQLVITRIEEADVAGHVDAEFGKVELRLARPRAVDRCVRHRIGPAARAQPRSNLDVTPRGSCGCVAMLNPS